MNRRLRSRRGLIVMSSIAVIVFVGRMLWVNGLFSNIANESDASCKALATLPGIEDIETVNGISFVSVASARGPDRRDGIYVLSKSGGLTKLSGTPEDFHPRGLGIYRSPDGSGIFVLAVNRHAQPINHKIQFSIDSFEVTNPTTNPALVAQGMIEGGLLTDPQDVAAAGPGAFYVTNLDSSSPFARNLATYGFLPGSQILYFNGMSFRAVADDLYGARGIVLTPDGGHVLVASLTSRSIKSFTREPFTGNLTEADSLTLPAAPENITLDSSGQIWAAGHANLLEWRGFASDPAKRAPSQIFRVTILGGVPQQAQQVYANDGSQIASASVASRDGNQLLIGSSLDNRLISCALQ